jgi:uncharacterized protein YfiM (DUF2279 family)
MKWTSLVALRVKDVCIPYGHIKSVTSGKEFIITTVKVQPLKKVLLILFVFLINSTTAQDTWNQQWLKQDKAAHMTASAFISAASIEMAKDFKISSHEAEIIGIATALGVGMSKEFLYDSNPSPYDMGVNIIGCVAGIYLNRWLQKKTTQWVNKKNMPDDPALQLAGNNRKAERHKKKLIKRKENSLADVAPQTADE